MFCSSNLINR